MPGHGVGRHDRATLVYRDLNGHGAGRMRGSGNRGILRYWHIGGFAVQHAAVDCAPRLTVDSDPSLRTRVSINPLSLGVSVDATVDCTNQYMPDGICFVTGHNSDVVKDLSIPYQLARLVRRLADQPALEDLSRLLADRDLNRLFHRDLRQTSEFGLLPGLLFALSGPPSASCHNREAFGLVSGFGSLFLPAFKYGLELRLHSRIRFLLDPFFPFLIFLLGALFHFLLIAGARFGLPFFLCRRRWFLRARGRDVEMERKDRRGCARNDQQQRSGNQQQSPPAGM